MLRASATVCAAAALLLPQHAAADFPLRRCPEPTPGARSVSEEDDDEEPEKVRVTFKSDLPVGMDVVWLNGEGEEVAAGGFGAREGKSAAKLNIRADRGHIFRVYANATAGGGERLLLHEVAAKRRRQHVEVVGCGAVEELARAARRAPRERTEEFEALAKSRPDANGVFPPCGPVGQSDKWSCVRYWPAEECRLRHKNDPKYAGKDEFGLRSPMTKGDRVHPIGEVEDYQDIYEWQRTKIPRVSSGPGFQIMNMPEALKTSLLSWYSGQVKAGKGKFEKEHKQILNNKDSPTGRVTTPRRIIHEIKREMGQVLDWWTNWTDMRHTATYGARVYSRGSVLLNHMDRLETHLASAILQVAQAVDPDGGWPVEIVADDDSCYEIFLQPGEMVLYEGARFRHGRPMALRGDMFANIFTHFSPLGWIKDEARRQARGEDEDDDDDDDKDKEDEDDDDEEDEDDDDGYDEDIEDEVDPKFGLKFSPDMLRAEL